MIYLNLCTSGNKLSEAWQPDDTETAFYYIQCSYFSYQMYLKNLKKKFP